MWENQTVLRLKKKKKNQKTMEQNLEGKKMRLKNIITSQIICVERQQADILKPKRTKEVPRSHSGECS